MSQLFKKILSFLLLFLFIPFSSCEKDSEQDSSQTKTKYNFTVREVSLSSLSHDTELLNIAGKIKPKKSNLSGKLIYDPLNDFYFDDTSGKEIVAENGQKSYTFQIITDDDNSKVENLLFTQKENGEYDAYRVQYNFTEEELKTMTIEDIAVQKANYTLITSSKPNFTGKPTVPCWSIEVWVDITPDKGNLVGADDANPYSGGYVAIAKVCSQSSTETETEIDGGSSGWGTGTFSGNQGPVSGSGIYTTPVVTPGTKFIKSIYPKILRSDFFSLSDRAHELTFNYLNLHNFDVISQSKVRGALTRVNIFGLSELPYETHSAVFDNLVKNDFSNASISFANEMMGIVFADAVPVDTNAFSFIFSAHAQNKIIKDLDDAFLLSMDQFMDADLADINTKDPDLIIYFGAHHIVKMARLKKLNPQWSYLKCYWEASKEVVHITLDVFGTVPVVGELADITNGALYVIEGDGLNATIS